MIRIENERQRFALTCGELCSLVRPNFLFVFVHEITKELKAIVLKDGSAFKNRFNAFEIDKSFFPLTGWYSYHVYEQESEDNVDPSAAALVEFGRAFVGSSDTGNAYTENSTTANFYEYDGR